MNYAEKCISKRETTLFFSEKACKGGGSHEKKREIPCILFHRLAVKNSSLWSLFRLFRLFFASFVSFFPFVSLCFLEFRVLQSVKEAAQHPERESRERERALAFLVFSPPHTPAVYKKSSQKRRRERRRDKMSFQLTPLKRT